MASQCVFCLTPEQRGQQIQAFVPELEASRCIYKSTPNFMTTVDMHPILPETPYFLLIPRYHYTSFSMISERHSWEIDEHLRYIADCVHNDDRCRQRHVVMFEHGQNKNGSKAKSIYHAHLHILWTDADVQRVLGEVLDELDFFGADYTFFHRLRPYLHTLHNVLSRDADYMYLRADDREIIAIDHNDNTFYSQFFRILICRALHERFIDWKDMEPWKQEVFTQRLLNDLPKRYLR